MRILADENVPGDAVAAMRQNGYDVVWVRTAIPGSSDEEILARAQTEDRILLTFDKDFGELAFLRGAKASHGIILLRIETKSPARAASIIIAALKSRIDWAGNFSVVEEGRIRMTSITKK
ncbi:MAG: hypothetical protein FJ320_11150 [SAR202 cluster bacterium]|nr:hypothetical protein [SAR202 cluster bacterium]